MVLAQKLSVRQNQSLVMTPQLSQSIKLLTMSNIELATFVESEMERNPFLVADHRADGVAEEARERNSEQNTGETEEHRPSLTLQQDLETSAQALSENLGTSIENTFPDEQDYVRAKKTKNDDPHDSRLASGGIPVSSRSSAHDQSVADFTADTISLRDHLASQLSLSGANSETMAIAHDIIDNLDESGYLRVQLEDISDRLGTSLEAVQKALKLVQSFEPCGVGARDLSECLRLQLSEKGRLDPAMAAIVDNLDLLAKRDFHNLRQLTDLEIDDLHDALLEIRALDPKPGTSFDTAPVQHIVADVFVREAQDGSWAIELNSETLPRVLINQTYAAEVSRALNNSQGDAEGKTFLIDCVQSANWLTRSLEQRAQTILKVTAEIVKQQDAFLVHGVRQLKPLTLSTVADAIDMHESSVSRVTSNKYVMTPRGLFELKYFFTASISATTDSDAHSAESVRDQIRDLIENETVAKVLSDDAIVAQLRLSGVDIARRTVAKYREAMHIPSSVQRRREKRALASIAATSATENVMEVTR